MDEPERTPGPVQRLTGLAARVAAGLGLALAVIRELLRRSGSDDHGMVVESDGDDAWAG